MVLRSDTYYRRLAHDALQQMGEVEPPVPIERLAEAYGIPVREVPMPTFFHGAAINEDGLPVIIINADRDEYVRRSTLAHMIGHILIVLADPEYTYPRNTKLEHQEADIIAEELMTPAELVIDQAQKWFNDHRYLARLFGVSEREMMDRMRELGIIKAQGIMWDY